jgi:hypothetical protein
MKASTGMIIRYEKLPLPQVLPARRRQGPHRAAMEGKAGRRRGFVGGALRRGVV